MKRVREVIKGGGIHLAACMQYERNKPHTYKGKKWKIIDATPSGEHKVNLILESMG